MRVKTNQSMLFNSLESLRFILNSPGKFVFSVLYLVIFGFTVFTPGQETISADSDFTFVFMTDIHIQPERNAVEGFKKAISEINMINPDFVITGGDLIYDALGVSYDRADSLYDIYNDAIKLLTVPVYNTIGNHEILGWYKKSGVPREHPEFGKKIFQNRIGDTFFSFEHKGVRFFILDSVEEVDEGGKYFGYVNSNQIDWLKKEIYDLDSLKPVIITTHIPFITTFSQFKAGSQKENDRGLVVENSKEVLDLFKNHNLKIVLQGHLHYFENLNIQNKINFVTGGAVSARWWTGPNEGMEEGFVIIRRKGDRFEVEYFEYGWDLNKTNPEN